MFFFRATGFVSIVYSFFNDIISVNFLILNNNVIVGYKTEILHNYRSFIQTRDKQCNIFNQTNKKLNSWTNIILHFFTIMITKQLINFRLTLCLVRGFPVKIYNTLVKNRILYSSGQSQENGTVYLPLSSRSLNANTNLRYLNLDEIQF